MCALKEEAKTKTDKLIVAVERLVLAIAALERRLPPVMPTAT